MSTMQTTSSNQLESNDKLNFLYSSDLDDVGFRIKIGSLEKIQDELNYKLVNDNDTLKLLKKDHNKYAHIYITCKLWSNGRLLCPSQQTPYKQMNNRLEWNEWLFFSIKFSDLPRDTLLEFTIWDTIGPGEKESIGKAGITIFSKHGAMRKGMYDLPVWLSEIDQLDKTVESGVKFISEKMKKIYKLKKQYTNSQMPKIDWLDRLTFLEIERMTQAEKVNSSQMYLSIEFPKVSVNSVEHTVVYFESKAEQSCQYSFIENDLVVIPDSEMSLENIVENKHHKLSRSARSGMCDRDLKPNTATRDQLNAIVLYPPTKVLTSEEQDLLWKFRFYLLNQKKALTKFLKSIKWQLSNEANQAIELLSNWEGIDIEDALELLSPLFQHPAVRKYAVHRLNQAPDDELLLYLLQLVQALKYENFEAIIDACEREKSDTISTKNSDNVEIVERKSSSVSEHPLEEFSKVEKTDDNFNPIESSSELFQMDLATFLINRACMSDTLANYFYWYLMVECEDNYSNDKGTFGSHDIRVNQMYGTVMNRFSHRLSKGGTAFKLRRSLLKRQLSFIEKLVQLMKVVARENGNRKKKIERLQALLSDEETFKMNFTYDDPLPLPLDPNVSITGVVPEKATLFKSALMPALLPFKTTDNSEYFVIFKHGDDLRQDQLILQMITLMDKLLRRENNLDLKLSPYRVLATSTKHGLVQYVESVSVAEVLAAEGSIQNYFRKNAPSNTPYGISSDVMDAYVKSCAGYCVITYLLGIGDRHLDNLLLTKTGKLFHVDFGFILGRDPKPFAPPMKLSREMVDAMGGTNSDHYQLFRTICYTAFLYLRSHANLILNLFSLMVDANVPDIALEPDKTVKKVQDRFRMDLNDEEAVHYMQALIDVSVKALFPAVVEKFHNMAQYLRN